MTSLQVFVIIVVCIYPSWQQQNDFLLLSFDTFINRIDLITGDMKLIHNASTNGPTISGLEYDAKHNCIFFGIYKRHGSKILQKCLDVNQEEKVIADDGVSSYDSLSYDWLTDLLYFVSNGSEGDRIEAVEIVRNKNDSENKTIAMNYMRRTIVADTKVECYHCDIAIHPVRKYLFWASGTLHEPAIFRSNSDGSDVWKIVGKEFTRGPIQISIDFDFDRIYWYDQHDHKIGRCDLNGNRIELFYLARPAPPRYSTAMVVTKDHVYWNNKYEEEIYIGNKDIDEVSKINLGITLENILSPLRLVSMTNRSDAQSPKASQIKCFRFFIHFKDDTFKCLCPNEMNQTATGDCICSLTGDPKKDNVCTRQLNDNFFRCANGPIIPIKKVCNDVTDCSDNSDELDCLNWTCESDLFQCKLNGKCSQGFQKCNGWITCLDSRDELECVSCGIDEEHCDEIEHEIFCTTKSTDPWDSE